MSDSKLQQLIELFEVTHRQLQMQAARSIDISLVVRNWLFGFYIVEFEEGAAARSTLYGKKLIQDLADGLKQSGLKGVSSTNLKLCRTFYLAYQSLRQVVLDPSSEKIGQTLSDQSFLTRCAVPEALQRLTTQLTSGFHLGWSHYVLLLTVSNPEERSFYEIEAVTNSWSVRELERQMNSSLYERLALSRDKAEIRQLAEQGLVIAKPSDIVKSPYVLEFLNLDEQAKYSESDLESAIIDKLGHFLLELGNGFLFEARQKRFSFDNDHFYVDLVFYNRLLRCHVLLDLKINRLTHQDLGQMQMYVNYFDRHVRIDGEAPTIGIVLCHSKNEALVELTLPKDSNIYAAEYQLYLPSKEEFQRKLLDWVQEVERRVV